MKKELETKTSWVVANYDLLSMNKELINERIKDCSWFNDESKAYEFIASVHNLGINTDGIAVFRVDTTTTLKLIGE